MAWLKLKIDDPLWAAPMHGFAGMTGLIMVGFLAKREYIYQVWTSNNEQGRKALRFSSHGLTHGLDLLQVYSGTHTDATWTPVYLNSNSTEIVSWDVTFADNYDNYPQGCFYYGAGGRLLACQVGYIALI